MDFTFTDEQQLLRQTVRDFTNAEVKPLAAAIDREHKIPDALIAQIKELGFLAIPVPEEYGGGGLGEVGLCIFMEEITRGWDMEVINPELFERNKNRPTREVVDELRRTYDEVISRLEKMSFESL